MRREEKAIRREVKQQKVIIREKMIKQKNREKMWNTEKMEIKREKIE